LYDPLFDITHRAKLCISRSCTYQNNVSFILDRSEIYGIDTNQGIADKVLQKTKRMDEKKKYF